MMLQEQKIHLDLFLLQTSLGLVVPLALDQQIETEAMMLHQDLVETVGIPEFPGIPSTY